MDSPISNLDRWKKLAADKRAKAFVLAVFVLIAVVVLQVGNLKRNAPVCELFSDCNLRNIDLHRMQIALSKSGLSEFEIKDNHLLVPKAEHAKYLQAVVEQNAVPPELCDRDPISTAVNPLLSRSQQIVIERETRKTHIEEMVARLPFVDTAWFEMDDSQPRSAFQPAEKSAVISIRPIEHQLLLDQHVDTVRQMIMGAVTGINPNQIVVIDLSSGLAHRDAPSKVPGGRRIEAQRVAYARQQMLENRLRESLADYAGLRVAVVVELEDSPDEVENQVAIANAQTEIIDRSVGPRNEAAIPWVAGANGRASIYDGEVEVAAEKSKISPASHQTIPIPAPIAVGGNFQERVSVLIDVPYELLVNRYGEPGKPLSYSTRSTDFDHELADAQIEMNFSKLKMELEQKIRPLIGRGRDPEVFPINFTLVRPTTTPSGAWSEKIRALAVDNWPSAAVLVIGLILITVVTQQRRSAISALVNTASNQADDMLTFNSQGPARTVDEPDSPEEDQRVAEVRLSQLIEQDPDVAARVIESWIRDAA